jgi:hypothetical protein
MNTIRISPRKRISYWHLTLVFKSLHHLKNFQTLDVEGGISTALSLEIQFKYTFNSSILIIEYQNRYSVTRKTFFYENSDKIFRTINN